MRDSRELDVNILGIQLGKVRVAGTIDLGFALFAEPPSAYMAGAVELKLKIGCFHRPFQAARSGKPGRDGNSDNSMSLLPV